MIFSPSARRCGQGGDASVAPPRGPEAVRRFACAIAIVAASLLVSAIGRAQSPAGDSGAVVPPAQDPIGAAAVSPEPAPAEPAVVTPSVPTARRVEPVASSPAPVAAPPVAPADLSDLTAWLEYKRRAHLATLPDESRLFYRRGLIAARAGQGEEAIRLVRGAAELDPLFVTPHLTLASWYLTRDPSQALLRYAAVLDLVRRSFLLQIEMVANLVFFALYGLFVGLLATAIAIVFLRKSELRHLVEERMRRSLTAASARNWSWALLIVPFVAGLGLAIPVVVFLGVLWPVLRTRERVVYVALLAALVAAPFSGHLIGRLVTPLREDRAPLYGTASLQDEAWSAVRQASLERLAGEHPDDPFVQFGLGWSARQGGNLATAEAAYRRALTAWPSSAIVLNNLANVMVAQGKPSAAIELYRRAITEDPECAAAHFNLSQLYTRQFEYRAASEAAARASALDFELVKNQQALGTEDGVLPLADQWLAPATFWRAVIDPAAVAAGQPALPAVLRGHIETAGPPFAAAVLVLGLGSILIGVRCQRGMPLRPCHNCGRVICRRCAQRRRELALCPACAEQESRAESPEFARVLLARQRGRMERSHRLARTTLAALLPGYGLLAFHRVFRATALIIAMALLAAPWIGVHAPFAYQTGPGIADASASPVLVLGAWALVYAVSLLGYLAQSARAASQAADLATPVRSRPSQVATTKTAKAA